LVLDSSRFWLQPRQTFCDSGHNVSDFIHLTSLHLGVMGLHVAGRSGMKVGSRPQDAQAPNIYVQISSRGRKGSRLGVSAVVCSQAGHFSSCISALLKDGARACATALMFSVGSDRL